MKKIYILALASFAFFGCQHDVFEEIDFNVTLDSSNTYKAGEPVRFNFEGNMDNMVFYSGEKGSEYKNRERYSIPIERVESATLSLSILSQYGRSDALEMWVTDKYEGLQGNDGDKDRERINALVMSDWQKIEYKDPSSGGTVEINLDVLDLKENFCIAFHWNPIYDGRNSQRTYKVNGEVALDIKGIGSSKMDFGSLDFTAVMMNEQFKNPYKSEGTNGEIVLTDKVYDLYFKGCPGDDEDIKFALNGWAISRPCSLNRIANDKGLPIKNTQNYMNSYEYTWDEPGTYIVTFVGSNSNYMGASQEVKEITVTIIENL